MREKNNLLIVIIIFVLYNNMTIILFCYYYRSAKGIVVPARSTGAKCKCRLKCFELIGDNKVLKVLEEFNAIGDKEKQDIYLAGLITPQSVLRRRNRTGSGKEKEHSFKYKVRDLI